MTELAWSLGVFASFVAGFGAGAFIVALGKAAGRRTPNLAEWMRLQEGINRELLKLSMPLTPEEAERLSAMADIENERRTA